MGAITATGCQLLVHHTTETEVASEKTCYGVPSPDAETVWGDCLSWWVHAPDYTNTDAYLSGHQPARGHAVQDAGVTDTSPAFCLQTGPRQKNPAPDQGTKTKAVKLLRQFLHEGFNSLQCGVWISRSSGFSPLLRHSCQWCGRLRGEKTNKPTKSNNDDQLKKNHPRNKHEETLALY